MIKKIEFIAEIGGNHNKSLSRCYRLINEAKKCGATAVKFQLFKLEKLYSKDAKKLYKSIEKKIRRFELPKSFIPLISKFCKKKKIKFGCTPFDLESARYLKNYVDFLKIASYELIWKELVEECSKIKKPLILSTGAANLKEISNAVKILKKNNHKNFSLLHCVSNYPAKASNCNLKSINFLSNKFRCKTGWSDHTVDPLIIYSAVKNFKARIVEFHFDIDQKGLEYQGGHCWLPNEIKKVIDFIKLEKKIDGIYKKKYSSSEKEERLARTDPSDGLRPNKLIRK